jgi:hypothetical protein
VSREITSPVLASSKKALESDHMGEDVAAQVGHDPLAERGDEVVAKRTREREHRHNADHDQKIPVDQLDAAAGKAEIDHPAHGDRHDQRRQCRNDQGSKRNDRPAAVAFDVWQEGRKRPQVDPAAGPDGIRWIDRGWHERLRDCRWQLLGDRRRRRILLGIEIHMPQCLIAVPPPWWAGQCPVRTALATCGTVAAALVSAGRSRYRPPNFFHPT